MNELQNTLHHVQRVSVSDVHGPDEFFISFSGQRKCRVIIGGWWVAEGGGRWGGEGYVVLSVEHVNSGQDQMHCSVVRRVVFNESCFQ